VHDWSTFGAWTSHEHTEIRKTHHNLELAKTTTFPLIVFFVMIMKLTPKCHFIPRLPTWESQIPEIRTPLTLEAYNFLCKPSIKVMCEAKL
jgi:hypothetical protein